MLQGTEGGNGVLVVLRPGDTLTSGEFPLLARADSATVRGAIVAARFMAGEVAHGVTLDSGAVSVRQARAVLAVSVLGSGGDITGAGRVALEASFEAVPIGSDTVACGVQR